MLWFARVHELQEALPVAAIVPENLEPQFPCRGAPKALVPAARPASTWCSTSGEPKWPVSRPFLSAGTPPSLQIEVPNDDCCADRVHVAVALPGARDAFLAPEQVLLNRLLLGAVVRHHAEVVAFQIVVGEVFHAGVVRASGRSPHVFDWVWVCRPPRNWNRGRHTNEERKPIHAPPAAITLARLLTDEELDSLEKRAGDGKITGADHQVDQSQALDGCTPW